MIIIVNPTSGGGAGNRLREEVLERLASADPELRITGDRSHAEALAFDAARSGEDAIVAVGGDGTIHEVANGMLRAFEMDPALPAVLGVVPVGTGNDFVKMIPGLARREDAYRAILAGNVMRVDAGLATWDGDREFFVNAAGTGIDVEVVRALGTTRGTRGPLDYVVALVRALRRYRPIPIVLQADNETIERRMMIAAVSNGRCVGGTFHICPGARIDDGLFDVCTVDELSLLASIGTAARILRGTHAGLRGVRHFNATTVELTVPEGTELFFQLDGELREPLDARSLRIEMRRGVLPVFALAPGAAA